MRSVFIYSLYPNTLEEEAKDLNTCVDFSFFYFGGEGAHNNVLVPLINFPKAFPHSGLVFLEILFSLLKLRRFVKLHAACSYCFGNLNPYYLLLGAYTSWVDASFSLLALKGWHIHQEKRYHCSGFLAQNTLGISDTVTSFLSLNTLNYNVHKTSFRSTGHTAHEGQYRLQIWLEFPGNWCNLVQVTCPVLSPGRHSRTHGQIRNPLLIKVQFLFSLIMILAIIYCFACFQYFTRCALLGHCWQSQLPFLRITGTQASPLLPDLNSPICTTSSLLPSLLPFFLSFTG